MNSTSQTQLPFDETRPGQPPPAMVDPGEAPMPASNASPPDPKVNLTGRDVATTPPMLLTVRDVEAELQLGRTRTYELIRSGQIPVIRLGRSVRIPRDALRCWIEANCASANPG
jgi:excisionase family DNA binding protein